MASQQKIAELQETVRHIAQTSHQFKIGRSGDSVGGKIGLGDRVDAKYDKEFQRSPVHSRVIYVTESYEECKRVESILIPFGQQFPNCINRSKGGGGKPENPRGFRVYVRFTDR